MSNSVRPHRRQPTRLPRPWDSPGKNTGVGCHFLLQCMKVKSENEVAQSCPTLSDPMDCSLTGSSVHGIFQARVLEWGAIAFSVTAVYKHKITHIINEQLVRFSQMQLFHIKSIQIKKQYIINTPETTNFLNVRGQYICGPVFGLPWERSMSQYWILQFMKVVYLLQREAL